MTSDNRDSASRLSDALDDLFQRRITPPHDDTDPTGLESPGDDMPDGKPLQSPVVTPEPEPHSAPTAPSMPSATLPPAPRGDPAPYILPPIVLATEESPELPPDLAPGLPPTTTAATESIPTVPRVGPATVPAPAPAITSPPTSWSDHMPVVTAPPAGEMRSAGRRPRVRRVTRVIRHVDPWSVFKVGLIFSAVMYVVLLSSAVLLWRVADSTGSLDNVERWFTQFGWETFEFNGDELFRNAWTIGLFGVVAMTGGLVLLATLFNLVSDIVGGVRVTVLEEEVVERTMSNARRYVVRRPVDAGTAGSSSSWSVDDDEPVNGGSGAMANGPVANGPVANGPVGGGVADNRVAGPTAAGPTVMSSPLPPTPSDWSVDD